jgi:ABC-type polysaccharide/polyol phosphate export permease
MQGWLMRANPLHHLITVVRAPLFGEAIEPLTWLYLGISTAVGLIAACWAYGRFARRVPLWV